MSLRNQQITCQIGRVLEARKTLADLDKMRMRRASSIYHMAAEGLKREESKLVEMVIFLFAPDETQ